MDKIVIDIKIGSEGQIQTISDKERFLETVQFLSETSPEEDSVLRRDLEVTKKYDPKLHSLLLDYKNAASAAHQYCKAKMDKNNQ